MAAELSSMRMRKQGGIMTHLLSAACEWFLIFLLFVDAAFSYLLIEFAKYCELQAPCPLCSRLDHVFWGKKLGCSWSLACSSHKEEISSFVFCSLHGKLAGFRGMCEECLNSIAMQNDSEYKLLVGKVWVDVERSSVKNPMLHKHVKLTSPRSRICSCCKKTWLAAKSDDERVIEHKPVGLGGYKTNSEPPLPHMPGRRHLSRRDGKRLRDKLAASVRKRPTGNSSFGTLGYTELKLSSGSESGNDGGEMKSDSVTVNHTRLDHDILDLNELKSVDASLSDAMVDHASREYSLEESQPKCRLFWTKDVVGSLGAEAESPHVSLPASESIHAVPSASSPAVRITKKSIYIEETCKGVDRSAAMDIEATAGASSDDSTCSSTSDSINLTGSLSHYAPNMKKDEEDNKIMSQASEFKVDDLLLKDAGASSSQSLPFPRNDSSYESLGRFNVSDDGSESSIIDQLRQQIEHDQSCMKSLHDELEEERKAADIAANQAMAMITRLQDEKAAAEMEALQYMRMMELQAEHDMESLERELLSQKEKELQDMQTELELYRNSFRDGSVLMDNDSATCFENSPATSGDSESAKFVKVNDKCDEKLYASHSLKKLVKNLYKDYCSEIRGDVGPIQDLFQKLEKNGSPVSNDACADANEDCDFNENDVNSATLDDKDSLKYCSLLHQKTEGGLELVQDIDHQLQKSRYYNSEKMLLPPSPHISQ